MEEEERVGSSSSSVDRERTGRTDLINSGVSERRRETLVYKGNETEHCNHCVVQLEQPDLHFDSMANTM